MAERDQLCYEQARDELIEVVRALEAGGTTLEESLALWERGEQLATLCQEWLDGARTRLDAALDGGLEPGAVNVPARLSSSAWVAEPKTMSVSWCHAATRAVSPPASVQVSQCRTIPLSSVTGAPAVGFGVDVLGQQHRRRRPATAGTRRTRSPAVSIESPNVGRLGRRVVDVRDVPALRQASPDRPAVTPFRWANRTSAR